MATKQETSGDNSNTAVQQENSRKLDLSLMDLKHLTKPIVSKLIAVGDGTCGKNILFAVIIGGRDFHVVDDHYYYPIDNQMVDVTVDGVEMGLALWNPTGGEDFDRLRPLSYPDTDVFLIGYSVSHSNSFLNVRNKFVPEIRHFCPKVPFILVATRPLDMDSAAQCISRAEGEALALEIGASAFFDVDFRNYDSVKAVFEEAARLSVLERVARRKKSKKCRVQ